MTIKQIQTSKAILFGATFALAILRNGDLDQINNLKQILDTYNLTIDQLYWLSYSLLNLNLISTFRLESLTSDYKDIKTDYDEIITRTAELAKDFNFDDDPIKMFAFYIYLYRQGYLSANHQFRYSIDMKDFPLAAGIDVVRGTGVCRSIASMFTDLCNESGMETYSMAVNVTTEDLNKKEPLNPIELAKDPTSKRLVKLVSIFSKVIPISNHLINNVQHNNRNYILDPTNDVFMYKDGPKKLIFANDHSARMTRSYISETVSGLFGQNKVNLNFFNQNDASLPDIDYEEYKAIYAETIAILRANLDILHYFYIDNRELYEDIFAKTADYNGLIGRVLPLPALR